MNSVVEGSVHNRASMISSDENRFERNFSKFQSDDIVTSVKRYDQVANNLDNGKDIMHMILTQKEDQLERAFRMLLKEEQQLKRNKFKKWVCTAVGTIMGGICSTAIIGLLTLIGFSFYNRSGLDQELYARLGNATFDDIHIKELMVASYEYNS